MSNPQSTSPLVFRGNTTIHFGEGAVNSVASIAASVGKRPLICTDTVMAASEGFARVREALTGAGLAVEVFDEATAEVPLADVEACAERARSHQADVFVALGGGSVIDLSKVTSLTLSYGGPLEKYYGEGAVPGPVTPIIAIPTTAGTGSEVTPVAVVTDGSRELKVGVSSPHLIPRFAICDPELTATCPPGLTAHSGVDALSHAIEAFTAARRSFEWQEVSSRIFIGKNVISDTFALRAIELIAANLETAVNEGSNLKARAGMQLGSTMAGLAFAQAGTAMAHALQYPIGAATHTPHGLGVGVLLPFAMRFNLSVREAELAQIAPLVGADAEGSDQRRRAEAAVEAVFELIQRVGFPTGLAELGVKEDQLDHFTEQASGITRLLDNNPRPASREDLHAVMEAALAGDLDRVPA